ncbi:MAG: hypothetical protein V4665_00070 [Patescibacteria group bacterium]
MKRIIFDIAILLCVFIFPWWVAVILGILGLFLFSHFYEFIAVCVALYALYAVPSSPHILASPLWFSAIVIFTYLGIQSLHRYIILYKS